MLVSGDQQGRLQQVLDADVVLLGLLEHDDFDSVGQVGPQVLAVLQELCECALSELHVLVDIGVLE